MRQCMHKTSCFDGRKDGWALTESGGPSCFAILWKSVDALYQQLSSQGCQHDSNECVHDDPHWQGFTGCPEVIEADSRKHCVGDNCTCRATV